MPRNSQGDFTNTYNWVQDAANGIDIEPDRHQDGDDDQAQGLTDSLDRQGRGGMNADLAMGNNKVTQVNEGTVSSDAPNVGQIQNGAFSYSGTDLGAADAYVVTLSPTITAYNAGLTLSFIAANANTGASTLQVDGVVPAQAIQWQSLALVADTIRAGDLVTVRYNGTVFNMISSPEILAVEYGGTGQGTPLGTAAYEDVGVDIGDVVQLEDVGGNAGLPAVDGSQLTGIATPLGPVRMEISAQNATTLQLVAAESQWLPIDGVMREIPATLTLTNAGMAASTLYYIYIGWTGTEGVLSFSATAYAQGSKGYLVQSGDETVTLVGFVITDGSTEFVQSATSWRVRSLYERSKPSVYASNAVQVAIGAGWTAISSLLVETLNWAWERVHGTSSGSMDGGVSDQNINVAIGSDGATFASGGSAMSIGSGGTRTGGAPAIANLNLAEGLHTFQVYAISQGSGVYGRTTIANAEARGAIDVWVT